MIRITKERPTMPLYSGINSGRGKWTLRFARSVNYTLRHDKIFFMQQCGGYVNEFVDSRLTNSKVVFEFSAKCIRCLPGFWWERQGTVAKFIKKPEQFDE